MVMPNLFMVGPPRCGTTSVYGWLSSHPEVCAASEKETYYFIDEGYPGFRKEANYNLHGLDGYSRYFRHCRDAKVVFEATPVYIYQSTALEAISSLRPLPKIIFILRKPSERIYSVYAHAKNFLNVIDRDMTFAEFIHAVRDEPARADGLFSGRPFLADVMKNSVYVDYVSRWVERMGEGNVGVFLFERLRGDSMGFMKDVSAFLGIDGAFWDRFEFSRRNEAIRFRAPSLHRFIRTRFSRTLRRCGLSWPVFIQRPYFLLSAEKGMKKTEEEARLVRELERDFLAPNALLAERFGVDISLWG